MSRHTIGRNTDVAIAGRRIPVSRTDLSSIDRISQRTRRAAIQAARRVAAISARLPEGWPMGLERALFDRTMPDVSRRVRRGALAAQGVAYINNLRLGVLARPPSELGVIALFQTMDQRDLVPDDVARAVGLMGGDGRLRNSAATTKPFPSGEYIEFFDPTVAVHHLSELLIGINKRGLQDHAVLRATSVYFAMTLYHPFEDGNGRAARALFQCVLKRDAEMNVPMLPLGPICECNRELLLDAKHAWQNEDDAEPLVQLLANAVSAYCAIFEKEPWLRADSSEPY